MKLNRYKVYEDRGYIPSIEEKHEKYTSSGKQTNTLQINKLQLYLYPFRVEFSLGKAGLATLLL